MYVAEHILSTRIITTDDRWENCNKTKLGWNPALVLAGTISHIFKLISEIFDSFGNFSNDEYTRALVWKYGALQLNYRIILFNTVKTYYQLVTIYNASVNKVNVNGVWVYCLINLTFNDISVIYVTVHAVRAYRRSSAYGRAPMP